MNTNLNNKWVWRSKPTLSARFRLICITHAGGTAGVFKDWNENLPDWIDVVSIQLPGRQQRISETMPTRMGILVRELASGIESELDLPYAIVGSCTGSLIAFELSHFLKKKGLRSPSHLFVISCRAPHLPDRDDPIHKYDDAQLLEELARLGGTSTNVLEHPEMMKIFGPILRRDFELAETYTYHSLPPLDFSFTNFRGAQDEVVSHDESEGWNEHTTADFDIHVLQGGHYLVEDAATELCNVIASTCEILVK